MIYNPRDYQSKITNYIIKQPRCAIFADMGMGKTSATLLAQSVLSLTDESKKCLVIGPLRVVESTWPGEINNWEIFDGIKTSLIIGKPAEREKAVNTEADIHFINYENIPWLVQTVGQDWVWDTIIADECTRLKSFRLRQGGSRAQALSKFAFTKVKRFIGLTGTPTPNGLLDLWGQMWFIDRGERLGRTFTAFRERWFYKKHINSYDYIPFNYAYDEIMDKISDVCLSVQAKDYFPLKDPVVVNVSIDLDSKSRKVYTEMEKNFFVDLKEGEVNATNAAAKSMKCLQIQSGVLYKEDGSFILIHDLKLEALQSIIEETMGAPLIVAYHFKSDLARLRKRFPQGKCLDDAKNIIDKWNKGDIPLLFLHPASAGHGLNLQHGGSRIVFFTPYWDLEQHQQAIGRIGPTRQLQSGYNRNVYIYYITARGTLDEVVLQRLTSKASIQDLIKDRMAQK